MRRLTILRHAETQEGTSAQADTDRMLTRHGVDQCSTLARQFQAITFDRVFVSPSLRTRETVRRALEDDAPVRIEERLYQASADEMEKMLAMLDDGWRNVLLVAHNPGISILARRLASADTADLNPATALSFVVDGAWLDFSGGQAWLDWRLDP